MFESDTARKERLKKRVDASRAYRERMQEYGKEYRERVALIRSAYGLTPMQFWCERCRKDFDATGYLHSTLWVLNVDTGMTELSHEAWPSAWYESECPKRHNAIRYHTDKHRDPYYHFSEIVKRGRARMERDLIQPNDPRFKLVYPEQWKRLQAEREAQEQLLTTSDNGGE